MGGSKCRSLLQLQLCLTYFRSTNLNEKDWNLSFELRHHSKLLKLLSQNLGTKYAFLTTSYCSGVLIKVQVRWTRVPDLVEKRRVLLKGGWAYVPAREQSSIVYQEFQTQLEDALEVTLRFV